MKTIAEVEFDVRTAVLNGTDRSLEQTVYLAVRAGIDHERARIEAILDISVPPGLEKALIAYAVHPNTTPEAAQEFIATFPLDPDHSAALRKSLHLVPTGNLEEASADAR